MAGKPIKARFFKKPSEFGTWLERNHAKADELWVGYYKKHTGRPSLTWAESVDEALCYGWIDGVRKSIDDDRYMNRFTRRRTGSNWSAKNINRVEELISEGRMKPSGLEAFEARSEARSGVYSYEQRHLAKLDPAYERKFRRNKKAWTYFQSSAPSYRKMAIYWVMSAKREETRERRLAQLIEDSAEARRVPPLTPYRRES